MRINKNKGVTIFLFLFVSFFSYALDTPSFSLQIEPLFQYRKTSIGEYVFFDKSESITLLSELHWDLNSLFLFGSRINFFRNGFTSSASFLCDLPSMDGVMTDADYYTDSTDPTIFSVSTAYLQSLCDVYVSAGYDVVQDDRVTINLFGAFQYCETSLTSYDGYIIDYSSATPTSWNVEGQAISYTQYLLFVWMGSVWTARIAKPLQVRFSMEYSPFCYARGWDIHHFRSVEFLDTMKAYLSFRGGIDLSFFFTKQFFLTLGASGTFLPTMVGETSTKEEGGAAFFQENGYYGGTSLQEARFTLSLSYMVEN